MARRRLGGGSQGVWRSPLGIFFRRRTARSFGLVACGAQPNSLIIRAREIAAVTKRLSIKAPDEIEGYRELLRESAEQTHIAIAELVGNSTALEVMYALKFKNLGCDPLNPQRPLNLIEQLNQSLTYLASLEAARLLFECHPHCGVLRLNLGTESGSDIESEVKGLIAAEVFAAVSPKNNKKLEKDLVKVSKTNARHRYVFFQSPSHEGGAYRPTKPVAGVTVWSLHNTL